MPAARHRVVVVGAGMAGLAAARRLHEACGRVQQALDLTILEGSNCVGGRIHTACLGGNQVELGATLIHGITGSPIYDIAQRIGALTSDTPRENYENRFQNTLFYAEGSHFPIDPHLLQPSIDLFRSTMAVAKGKDTEEQSMLPMDSSVGAFLQQRLRAFLSEQAFFENAGDHSSIQRNVHEKTESVGVNSCTGKWNPGLLQESAYMSMEALERSMSACNSLEDLDLTSFKEYTEFPGPHVTIGKGYISILKELENSLPSGTVKLEKKVQKVFWNHSHPSVRAPVVLHCEDGSVVQADHAILTVSLGVLKAGVLTRSKLDLPAACRSVMDLRGWKVSKEAQRHELFEPSLPPWKLDAIARLGFGVVNKLFLILDPAVDKRLLSEIVFLHRRNSEDVPGWLRKTFSMFPIYKGSNVVALWFAGDEALQMEYLSDEEVLDGVVQMLISFQLADVNEKQRLRSMFKGVMRSRWATEPLCQGSYSFVAVGSNGRDIDDLVRPLPETSDSARDCMGEEGDISTSLTDKCVGGQTAGHSPLQLLFAGEATHRNFYSTTHGAFLSGIREADRLVDYFEKSSQLS